MSDTRCYCGAELVFRVIGIDGLTRCECAYCREAVEHDGAAQYVIGFGRSESDALADWRAAIDRI